MRPGAGVSGLAVRMRPDRGALVRRELRPRRPGQGALSELALSWRRSRGWRSRRSRSRGWAASGRLRCAQEPSRGRRHAGPGIVVSGRLGGLPVGGWRLGLGRLGLARRGWLRGIVGLRLARARNHQAWRHGPGGNQIFRIIPAEQACTLPLLLRRGIMLTIPTRLVTFCTHHRPQSRHISGKMP